MTDHPITPPPELVQRLCDKAILHAVDGAKRGEIEVWLIQEAFRAGADRELEACCEWLDEGFGDVGNFPATLRAARRPKPQSLKERALEGLTRLVATGEFFSDQMKDLDTIRRALEALPE
jgi:hypothetical protein